jgi:tetratricopeptide (TPR) repeat protein
MGNLINDNNIYLQAALCFKKSLDKSPQFIDAIFLLGETYTRLYFNTLDEDYFILSDENFSKALDINPLDFEIYLKWASLLHISGNINKDPKKLRSSIEKCIKAHRRNKKDPLIAAQWVESLALLGAYTNRLELIIEAEHKIMKTIEIYSEESRAWYAYGICMNAFGIYYNDVEYDEFAIEKYQIGISLDKSSDFLWKGLGYSHAKIGKALDNCDMLEKACKFYNKALFFNSSSLVLMFDYGKTLLDTAEITSNQTLLEEAVRIFETALNLQKNALLNHPEWLFNYASALDLLGDFLEKESFYIKAIEIFNHVLLINPNYPRLHYRLALSLSHLLEQIPDPQYVSKAINCFKLAVKQDEEDDEIWLEWGLMLISFANTTSSQNEYFLDAEQKILRSGQLGNEQAYYNLACLYALMKRDAECINLLKKAEHLDVLPTLEEIIEDEWLDNIRDKEDFIHFLCELEKKEKIIE